MQLEDMSFNNHVMMAESYISDKYGWLAQCQDHVTG